MPCCPRVLGSDLHVSASPCSQSGLAAVQFAATAEASKALEIAVGHFHVCVITLTHEMRCWGDGIHGVLGNNANNGHDLSMPVGGDPAARRTPDKNSMVSERGRMARVAH